MAQSDEMKEGRDEERESLKRDEKGGGGAVG